MTATLNFERTLGLGTALVTPFDDNLEVDYPSLKALVERQIRHGVNFLVALGSTGEPSSLTADEKERVLATVLDEAQGRVPVVVGVGGNNTARVIDEIRRLPEGVAGILSVVPAYNKPSQNGIYQHFAAIAQATSLPIILYNVPGRTGANMTAATTLRLAKDFENIKAVKEASGNMGQVMAILEGACDDFQLLSGDDNLTLAMIAMGATGAISVASNAAPKECLQIVQDALRGSVATARKTHYRLMCFVDSLFEDGNPAGIKAALSVMRMCKNTLRLPLVPVQEPTYEKIRSYILKKRVL